MSKFDKLTEAYIKLYVDEDVSSTLDNVDDLIQFLINKNESIQNDLIEYVKSKSNLNR